MTVLTQKQCEELRAQMLAEEHCPDDAVVLVLLDTIADLRAELEALRPRKPVDPLAHAQLDAFATEAERKKRITNALEGFQKRSEKRSSQKGRYMRRGG